MDRWKASLLNSPTVVKFPLRNTGERTNQKHALVDDLNSTYTRESTIFYYPAIYGSPALGKLLLVCFQVVYLAKFLLASSLFFSSGLYRAVEPRAIEVSHFEEKE